MAKLSRETLQKKMIEDALNNFDSFFTGEELFEYIKKKHNGIGLATIYRFLKEQRERQLLHSYVCNRSILYSKENKNHCHFICEHCKKVEHFNLDKIDFLRKNIKGSPCHFQLDVYGLCESCRKKG
ncbi:MAG: transcriptional repressor [Nanoarchaeota archaeon]|nr:transcriptional repressor [Nanoarchaeota archaeon]